MLMQLSPSRTYPSTDSMLQATPKCVSLRSRHVAFSAIRTVFVMSHERRAKPRPKPKPKPKDSPQTDTLQNWAHSDDARKAKMSRLELDRKVKDLRKLAKNIEKHVNSVKPETQSEQETTATEAPSQAPSQDVFDPRKESLFTSVVALPESVEKRLGLAVKYLVTKSFQNWPMVIHQLQENGGFRDLPEKDVRTLVYRIPKSELVGLFSTIENLLEDADMAKSPKVVNQYLRSVIQGAHVSDEQIQILEKYTEELRAGSKNGILSRDTYEILIEAYGKRNSLSKVGEVIKEMTACSIQPSSNVYSNVLTSCVYKSRDHKQAVQLFDSMKFIAGSMAPKTVDYQNIIVSYVNNNDIEKALDIYQEMVDQRVELTQPIIVALARGCMSRHTLRYKAWDFIFEIYKRKWEPTVPTMEYILYLCARDGDLTLARAMYHQLNISNSISARSFGFLMLAYANSSITESSNYTVPAISFHEHGKLFRRNMLNKVDFTTILENPRQAVPFLPTLTFTSTDQLLSESSAMMAHALLVDKKLATTDNINTFLNVAAQFGSLEEFQDRFDNFTFFDATGTPESTAPVIEDDVTELVETEIAALSGVAPASEEAPVKNSTISPILAEILKTGNFKIPRDTKTYTIALKAASRHKNYAFSQKIWRERGTYRKSDPFKNLSRQQKDESDFAFATSMVHCLTEMNLLDDALAILVSTEYQFKWTWKQLSKLHSAAVQMGYDKVSKTVRGITQRAQVKYEGKIRKRDFKKYTSQRGY